MNEFEKLRKRLSLIKIDEQSDSKFVKEIKNTKSLIDSQEKYYNSILSSIRTSNTLANIIERLLKNVIYLENYERKKTYVAEAMYVNERNLKEEAESNNVITVAYLEQSRGDLSNNKAELRNLEVKLSNLNNTLKEKEEIHKNETRILNSKIVILEDEKTKLTNELKNVELNLIIERDSLKQCNVESKEMELNLNNKITNLEDEKTKLTNELKNVELNLIIERDSLKQCNVESKEMELNLEAEIRVKDKQISQLNEELEKNKKSLEECGENSEKVKFNIDELNLKNKELQDNIIGLNAKILSEDKTEDKTEELSKLKTQNSILESELIEVKTKLMNESESLKKYADIKLSLEKNIDDLNANIININSEKKDIESRLNSESIELEKIKQQIETPRNFIKENINFVGPTDDKINEITDKYITSYNEIPKVPSFDRNDSLIKLKDRINASIKGWSSYIEKDNINGITPEIIERAKKLLSDINDDLFKTEKIGRGPNKSDLSDDLCIIQ